MRKVANNADKSHTLMAHLSKLSVTLGDKTNCFELKPTAMQNASSDLQKSSTSGWRLLPLGYWSRSERRFELGTRTLKQILEHIVMEFLPAELLTTSEVSNVRGCAPNTSGAIISVEGLTGDDLVEVQRISTFARFDGRQSAVYTLSDMGRPLPRRVKELLLDDEFMPSRIAVGLELFEPRFASILGVIATPVERCHIEVKPGGGTIILSRERQKTKDGPWLARFNLEHRLERLLA